MKRRLTFRHSFLLRNYSPIVFAARVRNSIALRNTKCERNSEIPTVNRTCGRRIREDCRNIEFFIHCTSDFPQILFVCCCYSREKFFTHAATLVRYRLLMSIIFHPRGTVHYAFEVLRSLNRARVRRKYFFFSRKKLSLKRTFFAGKKTRDR